MHRNTNFAHWDRSLGEAVQALRQHRFAQAAVLLGPIVGKDSRKSLHWPNYRRALEAYAYALYHGGDGGQALIHQTRLLKLFPGDAEARGNFLLLLKSGSAPVPDCREFRAVLLDALSQTDVSDFVMTAVQALLADTAFAEAFDRLTGPDDAELVEGLRQGRFRALMQAPLLRLLMRRTLIPLPKFELLLRRMRKGMLLAYSQPGVGGGGFRPAAIEAEFLGALAFQLWLSEYASAEDEEESRLLESLYGRLEAASASLPAVSEALQADLAFLALYRSWLELPQADALLAMSLKTWKPFLQPLVAEWQGCAEERRIAAAVEAITPITGEVSRQVQRQYEENPFPRWQHDPVAQRRMNAALWLREMAPAAPLPERFGGPVEVLVAGCGTGLEPVSLVRQIETASLLAVDLSRASLAYAQRRSAQLGLAGAIEFRQADIMNLHSLDRRFDLITASGVLHHLEDPLAGWRVLTGLLRPGGIMLVSLYSEVARQTVVRAREVVAENGWEPAPQRMRQFRRDILEGRFPDLGPLVLWRDFYNLSMFRDLVFHVNEHRFSLPQIGRHLAELDLRFAGMRGLPVPVQELYRTAFPDDPQGGTLAHWAEFEARHPHTFASMYGLILQKPLQDG